MEKLAASLQAAWRSAQDLAPVTWEQTSERDQAVWLAVAAAAVVPEAAAANDEPAPAKSKK